MLETAGSNHCSSTQQFIGLRLTTQTFPDFYNFQNHQNATLTKEKLYNQWVSKSSRVVKRARPSSSLSRLKKLLDRNVVLPSLERSKGRDTPVSPHTLSLAPKLSVLCRFPSMISEGCVCSRASTHVNHPETARSSKNRDASAYTTTSRTWHS